MWRLFLPDLVMASFSLQRESLKGRFLQTKKMNTTASHYLQYPQPTFYRDGFNSLLSRTQYIKHRTSLKTAKGYAFEPRKRPTNFTVRKGSINLHTEQQGQSDRLNDRTEIYSGARQDDGTCFSPRNQAWAI